MKPAVDDRPLDYRLTLAFVLAASGLLAGALRVAGTPEGALRLPSILAGVATVGLIVLIAARLSGPRAGGAAGLLAALSPIHTLAAGDATLEPTLTLWASVTLWLALRVDAGERPQAALGLGLLLGLMASGSASLLGLAVLLVLWLAWRPDGRSTTALAVGVALLVLVLAGGLGLLRSPLSEGAEVDWAPSTTLLGMVRCAGASFTRIAGFEYHLVVSHAWFLAPLNLVVIALALLGARQLPPRTRWLLLGGIAVPFALGALLSAVTGRVTPLQASRMMPALPSLAALTGVGLTSLRGWRLWLGGAVVLGATAFFLGLAMSVSAR